VGRPCENAGLVGRRVRQDFRAVGMIAIKALRPHHLWDGTRLFGIPYRQYKQSGHGRATNMPASWPREVKAFRRPRRPHSVVARSTMSPPIEAPCRTGRGLLPPGKHNEAARVHHASRRATAWPLARQAQQPVPTIGFLRSTKLKGSEHLVAAFRQGLRAS